MGLEDGGKRACWGGTGEAGGQELILGVPTSCERPQDRDEPEAPLYSTGCARLTLTFVTSCHHCQLSLALTLTLLRHRPHPVCVTPFPAAFFGNIPTADGVITGHSAPWVKGERPGLESGPGQLLSALLFSQSLWNQQAPALALASYLFKAGTRLNQWFSTFSFSPLA